MASTSSRLDLPEQFLKCPVCGYEGSTGRHELVEVHKTALKFRCRFGCDSLFSVPAVCALPAGLGKPTNASKACIQCGCTDERACPEGCSWVREGRRPLCSACKFKNDSARAQRKAEILAERGRRQRDRGRAHA